MAEDPTPSSLLDDIRAAARTPGPRCGIALITGELSEEDRQGLATAYADGTISGSIIGTALRKRGFKISDDSVRRHRTGKCSCEEG